MPRTPRTPKPKGFDPKIEARVQDALRYHRIDGVGVRTAARMAGAPVDWVRCRLKGLKATGTRGGFTANLSIPQEAAIVEYIEVFDSIGLNPSVDMVKETANTILRKDFEAMGSNRLKWSRHKSVKLTAAAKRVDPHWFSRFLKWHPQLEKKWQKTLDKSRKKAHNKETIQNHFDRIKMKIVEWWIKNSNIWNFDETDWQIDIKKEQKIVYI